MGQRNRNENQKTFVNTGNFKNYVLPSWYLEGNLQPEMLTGEISKLTS